MRRKEQLVDGATYHIFNKSIAGFTIFNNDNEYLRMLDLLKYYQLEHISPKFSQFIRLGKGIEGLRNNFADIARGKEKLVQIIAYCLMPTHFHCVLKQLKPKGASTFMGNTLNSYTKYFNIIHGRKGPLWEGKFKNILIDRDEQLLHLTRYIHLNPVTSILVDSPEDWLASSYKEYLQEVKEDDKICHYDQILEIEPDSYKRFTIDRIGYQRDLAKIKKILIE